MNQDYAVNGATKKPDAFMFVFEQKNKDISILFGYIVPTPSLPCLSLSLNLETRPIPKN